MPLHYKEDPPMKIYIFQEKDSKTPYRRPCSAPALLVPKKKGKLWLVIDYGQLNKQIKKLTWPILSKEDIFDTLEGSACITSIDMSAGFDRVLMEEFHRITQLLRHGLDLLGG